MAYKLGNVNPASLINGYVAAANILGALAGPSGSDNAPVLEALSMISHQIGELRQEMNARFDILEQQQRDILAKLEQVLELCQTTKQVLTNRIQDLSHDLESFQSRVDTQTRQALLDQFSTQVKTARTYSSSLELRKEPGFKLQVNNVLIAFVGHSITTSTNLSFSGLQPDKQLSDSELGKAARDAQRLDLIFGLLPQFAARIGIDVPKDQSLPNPIEWERGARAYLETRILIPEVSNPEYNNHLGEIVASGKNIQAIVRVLTDRPTLIKESNEYSKAMEEVDTLVWKKLKDFQDARGEIFLGTLPPYKINPGGNAVCRPCAAWTYFYVPIGLPILKTVTQQATVDHDPIRMLEELKIAKIEALPHRPGAVQTDYQIIFTDGSLKGKQAPLCFSIDDLSKSVSFLWLGRPGHEGRDLELALSEPLDYLGDYIAKTEESRRDDFLKELELWLDTLEPPSQTAFEKFAALQSATNVLFSLALDADTHTLCLSNDLAPLGSPDSIRQLLRTALRSAPQERIRLLAILEDQTRQIQKRLADLANGTGNTRGLLSVDELMADIAAYEQMPAK